ncbi:LuxR C-terminal-related transcriptional regulator [Desulfobacterales bacterium HSG2]|nr:LuxR C-terminal-related transcriptional regulator [Desulfobacterales bacterium HSG2]
MNVLAPPWDTIAQIQSDLYSQTRYTRHEKGFDEAYSCLLDKLEPSVCSELKNRFQSLDRNRRRKYANRERLAFECHKQMAETTVSLSDKIENLEILERIRSSLSQKEWDMISSKAQGRSCQEIAKESGKSVSAVRSAICRLRAKIKISEASDATCLVPEYLIRNRL